MVAILLRNTRNYTLMAGWRFPRRWRRCVAGIYTGKDKYRGPSPFDYAQGQDDDVRQATANAGAKTNTGVLHCVQDDDVKQTTANAEAKTTANAQANANTEILSCAQNDDLKKKQTE
jgi:hypothetical protein